MEMVWFHSNPGFDVDRIRYDTNHEVKEALGHRDVGNVRAPDPIDPLDRNPAEEMPSNNSPFGLSGRGSQRCMYSSGGNPQIGVAVVSAPAPARADPEAALARLSGCSAQPLGRRRQGGIDPGGLMGIAAAFDKGAHRSSRLGLAQQHAVHAAAEDLAELPRVEAD